MANEAELREGSEIPRNRFGWPFVTLALLGAAWLMFVLVQEYSDRLMQRYGPAPDVWDALDRGAFVNRHTQPYRGLIVLLLGLALASLAAPCRPGWPKTMKFVVAFILVPSALLHVLLFFLGAVLAG